MRAPILFIYHANCPDGFTAAWVFDKFKKKGLSIIDQPVEYYPATYGQDPPDCKGKEVWLVDFTYPRETLIEKVIKPSMKTIIYDHHLSAMRDLMGGLPGGTDSIKEEVRRRGLQRNDEIIFDMHRSGCGILYDELAREYGKRAGQHIPSPTGDRSFWLVDYIEDRDLWKLKRPHSKEIAAFCASSPMTFEEWDKIEAMGVSRVAEAGKLVLRYIDTYGDKAIEHATYEQIGEHKIPCINVSYMNCSDHVGKLTEKNPDAPYALGYFRRGDGKWQFSLRSRGDFDVSEIAKMYGGGGHKNAAGFQLSVLPWSMPVDPLAPQLIPMGENSE
jgi:oligoribonuclease NrnB/cAMP/cGMP phosphodiesterase (DHH superfamily)